MTQLTLDVRLDGFSEPVGSLSRNENDGLSFQYRSDYLGIPLSLSMPIGEEPFDDVISRAFFDNLLQERNEPLAAVMTREGIARDDIAGLLLHLGKDCAGAVSVLPKGAPPLKVPGDFSKDYVVLSNKSISAIVKNLHTANTFPDGTQDPSPLAGVQNKFAIAILPNGDFAFPKVNSGAPTTHIIKVPRRNHSNDARLENEALLLSKNTDIKTVHAEVRVFEDVETLLIKRFDRALNANRQVIRLHQEDFAQALGLPRELKYERDGKAGRRFDAQAIASVLNETGEPAIPRSQFIAATFFDLLTGNADAHAKNHALLYEGYLRPNLSPRYDILPTRLDPDLTDELPYQIGNAKTFATLSQNDIDRFLMTIGIVTTAGRKRLTQNVTHKLTYDLAASLNELQRRGQKLFADLIASNIRILCEIVGVDIPPQAQNRDAFISHNGGWGLS